MTSSTLPVRIAGSSFRSSYGDYLSERWREHRAARETDAPTVISTFAGCGGSSLGYSMAGYRELLMVEWDANAVATFRHNLPDVPVYQGDIAELSVQEVLEQTGLDVGELDVLDGSPPCQGFSTAGKRVLDDSRNQLFREYVRLIRGLQPKVLVMENVSGMVKGKMKLVFVEILAELKTAGYRVRACLLNAAYFHVPQTRQRMIFIGVRNDLLKEPTYPAPESDLISLREALRGLKERKQEGATVSPLRRERWQETERGKAHHERFSLLRLDWNRPVPTILKVSGSGGHMHPDEARLLSIGELQRCASFPDEFDFIGSWSSGVERIGNSVPPLMMRAIAAHLRQEVLT